MLLQMQCLNGVALCAHLSRWCCLDVGCEAWPSRVHDAPHVSQPAILPSECTGKFMVIPRFADTADGVALPAGSL